MRVRYRGTLAYDGTAYQGFQRQAEGVPSIQQEVERAAAVVTGHPVTVWGAGRTDAGVHASGQVIAFDAEWGHQAAALQKAINWNLPEDIALLSLEVAEKPTFHPRFDAASRTYQYVVVNSLARDPLLINRAWHIWGKIDGEKMQTAADLLMGTHDFGGFGNPPQGENTVRTVFRSEWKQEPHLKGFLWTYTIEANAFLQHMARRTVGALISVGRGNRSVEFVEEMLRSAEMPVGLTIAPPQGLTLVNVRYRAGETPAEVT
jgi:tRNA pseudouridine38-40 synthase